MHVEGDGVVLELHGFTVEIQSPETAAATAGRPLDVRARVTMLCGCPTEPGGMWDADRILITARIVQDGRVVAEAPLPFAGQTSTYGGTITPPAAGAYTLEVLAVDRVAANAGLATLDLVVEGAPSP
jgi:hypothetical protein